MSNNRIDRTNKILKLEGISGEGLMRKSFSRINRVTSNINSKYKKEDDDVCIYHVSILNNSRRPVKKSGPVALLVLYFPSPAF